jgi:hypothetical protein
MPVVHIRLLELRTDHRSSAANKLMISAETTSPRIQNVEFHCAAPTQRERHPHSDEAHHLWAEPLDWFPTNCVVREWFPMATDSSEGYSSAKTMIRLDIRVNDRRAGKFQAAFSNLRVSQIDRGR